MSVDPANIPDPMTTTSVPDINRSTSQQPGIAQTTVDNTSDDNETRQFHSASFRKTIGPTVTLPGDSTALDFFNLMFGDDTCEMIAEETNRYAQQIHQGTGTHGTTLRRRKSSNFWAL